MHVCVCREGMFARVDLQGRRNMCVCLCVFVCVRDLLCIPTETVQNKMETKPQTTPNYPWLNYVHLPVLDYMGQQLNTACKIQILHIVCNIQIFTHCLQFLHIVCNPQIFTHCLTLSAIYKLLHIVSHCLKYTNFTLCLKYTNFYTLSAMYHIACMLTDM